MNKALSCLPVFVSMLAYGLCLVGAAAQAATSAKPELQFVDGSIAAKVDDHGDYYIAANGQRIKIYRKRGIFAALPQTARTKSLSKVSIPFGKGTHLKQLSKHNLTGANVIKMTGVNQLSQENHLSHARRTSGANNVQPVFTSKAGLGDLLLLPKFTVSLDAGMDTEAVLQQIKVDFNLQVEKKLELSGDVFSLSAGSLFDDPRLQFAMSRRLASVAGVKWAEPQFYMQANKAQFTPTDSLYAQQWNLNNRGFRGSRCDADCDALNAWQLDNGTGAATGAGTVIAIIDDGIQLNHPDLTIAAGGRDFVDDENTPCGDDGDAGEDSDANPSPVINCVIAGDAVEADNHGTAVAGIAAAKQGNGGVVGAAFNASILPIRAVSDYDVASLTSTSLCNRLAEAVEYAAQKADVVNLSWNLPLACSALTEAIERTTLGTVTVGDESKRTGGSPVVVASGNSASGWVKVTAAVDDGEHAYEWRYLRSDTPNTLTDGFDETVWLDDIIFPDGAEEGFESISAFGGDSGFTTAWELNQCNDECTFNFGGEPVWGINTGSSVNYMRSGLKAASINTENSDCGNSYLHTLREGPAGEISFWVWVSADTQDGFDRFEFLIDGQEVISYGDLGAFGFVDNRVAYPANLSNDGSSAEAGVISVGASTSGDLSGLSSVSVVAEYRAPYSQFGPTLDVVAPSGDQHLGITTTDRFSAGSDTLGFNTSASIGDLSDKQYTQNFSGTSAAAPLVSGVAAAIIASAPTATAQQVKDFIKNNTDKIGNLVYVNGRNDQFGHGRVNMFKALQAARGNTVTEPIPSCAAQSFDYTVAADFILPRYQPQASAGVCPALGPVPQADEICFPILASNGKAAIICL